MHINETRTDVFAFGVDGARSHCSTQSSDGSDPAVAQSHIGIEGRVARTVQHHPARDKDIVGLRSHYHSAKYEEKNTRDRHIQKIPFLRLPIYQSKISGKLKLAVR
jgi:hypothetical protein